MSHTISGSLARYLKPHPEGRFIAAICVIISFLCFNIGPVVATTSVFLSILVFYFFRNPTRVVPDGDNLVVSPADGIVDTISEVLPPEELEMSNKPMVRVSIFLSVLDVHVNRVPVSGKVTRIEYNPGKFISATTDKASDDNERNSVAIETDNGVRIACVQIAGLIARRIVCSVKENRPVKIGDELGIIKFGSRVDVYLPLGTELSVKVGQTCVGAETIIAKLGTGSGKSKEKAGASA